MHFQKPPAERNLLNKAAFHLRCRERWGDRIRYVLRLSTTSTIEDWTLVALPESLSFLYVLLRLPRLFRKYGLVAGGRAGSVP